MTRDEKIIDAVKSGISVQDFLWGDFNLNKFPIEQNQEIWISVFQKRVDKIREIDFNNQSSKIELRKRILQQACLSIQALLIIDDYLDFPNFDEQK